MCAEKRFVCEFHDRKFDEIGDLCHDCDQRRCRRLDILHQNFSFRMRDHLLCESQFLFCFVFFSDGDKTSNWDKTSDKKAVRDLRCLQSKLQKVLSSFISNTGLLIWDFVVTGILRSDQIMQRYTRIFRKQLANYCEYNIYTISDECR